MPVNGKWNVTIKTPMGDQKAVVELTQDGGALNGKMSGAMGSINIENGKVEGDTLKWNAKVTSPMPLTLEFTGKQDGANLAGNVKFGSFGSGPFSGTPA